MTESGELIRDFRRNQTPKMTLKTLADKVGITKASLSRIETGKLALSTETAKKLAVVMQVPLRQLLPELAELMNAPPAAPDAQADHEVSA